jgi:3',5'-cyclic AMP phosphodiesterase CpdA
MYRIIHISDLHFLQKLVNRGLKVEAEMHNEHKMTALNNALRMLSADLIVVTGDLTNFGDSESLDLARKQLQEMRQISDAEKVLCVPGNHDTLVDRAQAIQNGPLYYRVFLKVVSLASREVDMARTLGHSDGVDRGVIKSDTHRFLETYINKVEGDELGILDPAKPVELETPWCKLFAFLFNSTNDGLLMCNEGAIGPGQYAKLNQLFQDPNRLEEFRKSIRIALLHHHPIAAPVAEEAIERGFNSMRDGTEFLTLLNRRGFHLLLHGHQHKPFQAQIRYGDEAPLQIVAAGSALAGSTDKNSSFNVIDLLGPFQAHLRRFDYANTGYDLLNPKYDIKLDIHTRDHVRLSRKGTPITSADNALRNLVQGHPLGVDESHSYELLEYAVEVNDDQEYIASYRRKGRVERLTAMSDEDRDLGIKFLITGSPGMTKDDMLIKAKDSNGKTLQHVFERDNPNQKLIFVKHRTPLKVNEEFDITLDFIWRASKDEPNSFDGLNLMGFRQPVAKLRYKVTLPWDPVHYSFVAFGLRKEHVDVVPVVEAKGDRWTYEVDVTNPRPLAYLMIFQPQEP